MSSYPLSPATNKHDLLLVAGEEIVFASSSELFAKVCNPAATNARNATRKLGFVYSYNDGPEYPGPISRSMLVLGYADRSLSTVRNIVVDGDTPPPAAAAGDVVCDGLHSCTIAVKLADEQKRYDRLDERHRINSMTFAKFVTKLRNSRRVAILGTDKYGRFGLLVPYECQQQQQQQQPQTMADPHETDAPGRSEEYNNKYEANDFAARIYIGDVNEIKKFIAITAGADPGLDNNDGKKSGSFQPTSPPPTIGGWEPTSPKYQAEVSVNQMDNNTNEDEDEGPIFKPDDDENREMPWNTTTGGTEEHSNTNDDNNNDGNIPWNATTDIHKNSAIETNGDSTDMPWNTITESNGDTGEGMPWNNKNESSAGDNEVEAAPMPWDTTDTNSDVNETSNSTHPWSTYSTADTASSTKRSFDDMTNNNGNDDDDNNDANSDTTTNKNTFHTDSGAAAADAFYSGLTRNQGTQDQSWLFHMRKYNNWVKATHIAELDPTVLSVNSRTGKSTIVPKEGLRVLDLACGKGGDLGKWIIHKRGMKNYVGIDVARGSLKDAAIRARQQRKKNKLSKAIFSCADLGSDVPGRKRYPRSKQLQKLSTWSLEDEAMYESGDPVFKMERGGGISETDKFDIVSIQFAIHYMMQTRQRARRFFHTVSQLLDIGGNLAFTTMDARVIIDHMLNLGLNYHFEDGNEPDFNEVIVKTGGGACQLKFDRDVVRKIFQSKSDGTKGEEDLFGLEYTFTLVEGEDHAAGAGNAVNLPEWLIPIPVLITLGKEAGLELEYAQNFHEFFDARSDPNEFHAAHQLMVNMKVPNRNGTVSKDEWSISRMYMAVKFRKVRESTIVIHEDGSEKYEEDNIESEESKPAVELDPIKAKKMYPMAMLKAKRSAGEQWALFSKEEKEHRTQTELLNFIRKSN